MIIGKIFLLVEMVLKLLKLWDHFGDYMDTRRTAEAEEKRQAREKAIRDLDQAKSDDDIFNEQEKVVDAKP